MFDGVVAQDYIVEAPVVGYVADARPDGYTRGQRGVRRSGRRYTSVAGSHGSGAVPH